MTSDDLLLRTSRLDLVTTTRHGAMRCIILSSAVSLRGSLRARLRRRRVVNCGPINWPSCAVNVCNSAALAAATSAETIRKPESEDKLFFPELAREMM